MKKQRLNRSQKVNSSKLRRFKKPLFGLESLEDRHLLAANVLTSVNDSIGSAGQIDDVNLSVDISGGGSAVFVFNAVAVNSAVNTSAPIVKTMSGSVITPISSLNNASGLNGRTVVALGDGEFVVEVSGEGMSTGAYRLDVSLLGDVDMTANDRTVSNFEQLRASAAVIQFLGTGNHVTDLFYQQRGINMSVSQYNTGFDVDMDGGIEPFELGMVEGNQSITVNTIELQADVTAPVISNLRLTNDTGTSGTDRITTDPRVAGQITDENLITSVTARLDSGATVDITGDLGNVQSSVNFTLTRSVLDRIAGGSLSAGAHTLALTATDEFGNASSASTLTFTFIPTNSNPTGNAIPQQTVNEDSPFSFNVSTFFSDPNPGDVLTFTATGRPSWLSISPQGVLSGTPGNNDVTTSNVTITATDSQGSATSQPVIIVVNNTPDPPVIQPIADQSVNERMAFSLDIRSRVTDPDPGDVPIITVDRVASMNDTTPLPLPAWLTFNQTTGILSGTPGQADVGGPTLFRVFVVDQIDGTGTADEFFSITVIDVGDPPVLDTPIPDDSVDQRQQYSINFNDFFSDPDVGDTLTYAATLVGGGALPAWLVLNQSTGVLSGTPTAESDVGVMLNIQVTATDSRALSTSDSYVLTVNNVNDAPSVADQTFRVEPGAAAGTVVGTIAFSDPENDLIGITVTGGTGQTLFNVNSASGEITVANGANLVNMQSFTLNVTATDSGTPQLTDTAVITINVTDNVPPVANDDSGFETEDFALPLSIDEADLLSNDTDVDAGDMLTISGVQSTSSRGASVSFNAQTRQVSYNSASSDELLALRPGEQVTDTFTYTVSDGNGGTDMATVSVVVIGTDTAEFFLEFFDSTGTTPVTSLTPGQQFTLIVSVQDRRLEKNQGDTNPNNDIPAGIFAAFLDVTYPSSLVSTSGPINHLAPYDAITSGSVATPGLIDEAGGADGLSPLGPTKRQVFSVPMTAGQTPGTLNFASDPVEDQGQFGFLAYLEDRTVPSLQLVFGTGSIVIAGVPAPLSASAPRTNFDNPFDVDGDNQVALKDALMIINGLQTGHFSNSSYPDVNADGKVVLQDALQVLNAVQIGSVPQSAMSGSATANDALDDSDDAHQTLVDSIFADLS